MIGRRPLTRIDRMNDNKPDPAKAAADLDVPEGWRLIAYFCVGYPEEEHEDPELVRFDWQARTRLGRVVLER